MNLVQALLSEHSKAMSDKIVRHIGNDPKRFADLVRIYLAGPYRVTQRAAWPLSHCGGLHPSLIRLHLRKILKAVRAPGIHDAVKRNTVRMLQFIEIPKAHQGDVAAVCFEFLMNPKEPIAVRVFSMTVLANLAKLLPDLQGELRIVIEDQLPFGSPGFINRAKKILKDLKPGLAESQRIGR